MIIFGIQSTQLSTDEQHYLKQANASGVILFARNYQSPEQLITLCASIREIAPKTLICVDHEGGRVQRFKAHFTVLPPAAAFGKVFDDQPILASQLAEAAGLIAAYELRQYEIDFTFAPVLDLQDKHSTVIGDRAFHWHPAVVSELSRAFRRGLAQAGMAAVGKHFPGHGRVTGDSHLILPRDKRSTAEREQDIFPFLRNIETGIEAIMPAHILYPEIDNQYPASFSPAHIQSLRELGFDGAILSDDLDMNGAEQFKDPIIKVQTALDAGTDAVLICNNFSDIDAVMHATFNQREAHGSKARLNRLHAKPIPLNSMKTDYQQAVSFLQAHSLQLTT